MTISTRTFQPQHFHPQSFCLLDILPPGHFIHNCFVCMYVCMYAMYFHSQKWIICDNLNTQLYQVTQNKTGILWLALRSIVLFVLLLFDMFPSSLSIVPFVSLSFQTSVVVAFRLSLLRVSGHLIVLTQRFNSYISIAYITHGPIPFFLQEQS